MTGAARFGDLTLSFVVAFHGVFCGCLSSEVPFAASLPVGGWLCKKIAY